MNGLRGLLWLSLVIGLAWPAAAPVAADIIVGEAGIGLPNSSLWEMNSDVASTLYISDYTQPAIHTVDANGQRTRYLFDASASYLLQPSDPKPDGSGSIWWSDYASTFGKLNTSTQQLQYWDLALLELSPAGFGFDAAGRVWFTQAFYPQLLRFTPADNSLCQFEVGGGGDYLISQAGALWITDRQAGRLLRFDATTNQLQSWTLPATWVTPEGLALDGDGRLWWADSGEGIIGRLTPNTNQAVIYALPSTPSGSQPLMLAPGTEVMWYSDGGGIVGFIDPARAVGSTQTLALATVTLSAASCTNLGAPAIQTGVVRSTSALTFPNVTWAGASGQTGVTRYMLPGVGPNVPVPWGIAFSQGRTWVVDQNRLVLARTPRLPLAPTVSIQLGPAGAQLAWPAVTNDEGNGSVTVASYQVWRSNQPYFRPWDASGVVLAGLPTTTSLLDPVSPTPGSSIFYGVRSVAASGLLSRTSAHVGAFSFALAR